jgi:HEAT repeat protein
MASSNQNPRKKNLWLIPLVLILLGGAAFLGLQAWQGQQQAAEEQYRRELRQFGVREMGQPVLSAPHFARHGEAAMDDVQAILTSSEANDLAKAQAMEVILLVRRQEAAPLLIRQVEQQPSPLREQAVSLLGRTESAEAAAFLLQLTQRAELTVPALAALAELPNHARQHQDRILALLESRDAAIAAQAALTLGSLGTPEAREALLSRLQGPLGLPAARGLARMQEERGIQYLLSVLQGDRPGDRGAAEAGLAEAGETAAPAVESLLNPDNPAATTSAFRVLRLIGDPQNHPKWTPFLQSADPEVRRGLLELLAVRLAAPAGREVFHFLAKGGSGVDEQERAIAERVVRQAAREDFGFYQEKLESGAPAEQLYAIRTIAYSQDRRAIDLLVGRLSDDTPAVRRESAMSLGRMHGVGGLGSERTRVHDAVAQLAENDPNQEVRQTARSLLVVLRQEKS